MFPKPSLALQVSSGVLRGSKASSAAGGGARQTGRRCVCPARQGGRAHPASSPHPQPPSRGDPGARRGSQGSAPHPRSPGQPLAPSFAPRGRWTRPCPRGPGLPRCWGSRAAAGRCPPVPLGPLLLTIGGDRRRRRRRPEPARAGQRPARGRRSPSEVRGRRRRAWERRAGGGSPPSPPSSSSSSLSSSSSSSSRPGPPGPPLPHGAAPGRGSRRRPLRFSRHLLSHPPSVSVCLSVCLGSVPAAGIKVATSLSLSPLPPESNFLSPSSRWESASFAFFESKITAI